MTFSSEREAIVLRQYFNNACLAFKSSDNASVSRPLLDICINFYSVVLCTA